MNTLLILLSIFTCKQPLPTTNISWYSSGSLTSCGEIFSPWKESAASNFVPMGTVVRFYPPGREPFDVVINDTGPFAVDREGKAVYPLRKHPTRGFDLSFRAFKTAFGNLEQGIARDVPYEILGRKVRRTMRYNLNGFV